jgi:hypothetical protein
MILWNPNALKLWYRNPAGAYPVVAGGSGLFFILIVGRSGSVELNSSPLKILKYF